MFAPGLLRFDTTSASLRAVAFLEGVSYLVLLFVAMPLKYLADQPLSVRIAGTLHGVLFVALALLILHGWLKRGQSFAWGLRIGVASLLPFGTFFLDRELHAEDEARRAESDRG